MAKRSTRVLKKGSKGTQVRRLQKLLKQAGFSPGRIDGDFGERTREAVKNFQASEDLLVDGIAGRRTMGALGLSGAPEQRSLASLKRTYSVKRVTKVFPKSAAKGIRANLGEVLSALHKADLADDDMVLMALATIRAETAAFVPIPEGKSKYNTSPGGHPFDLYDCRKDLGNKGEPDGDAYKGRGFVQLTGRHNYRDIGKRIGLGSKLEKRPDLACEPEVAAKILAAFLAREERRIRTALLDADLKAARRAVNGGSHGLKPFSTTFNKAAREFIA